jgi:hypothetical protein
MDRVPVEIELIKPINDWPVGARFKVIRVDAPHVIFEPAPGERQIAFRGYFKVTVWELREDFL